MRFTTALVINVGAAIGYFAARQLLSPESAVQLDRLPEAARVPARAARDRLLRARARAAIAWNEGRAERDEAERELRREYRERTAFPRPQRPERR